MSPIVDMTRKSLLCFGVIVLIDQLCQSLELWQSFCTPDDGEDGSEEFSETPTAAEKILYVGLMKKNYSSASFKACISISGDKRKLVCFIFSRSGLTEGIIPLSFAFIITPIVPV